MRVLIIEDDAALADALATVLGDAGIVAEACGDGREAEMLGCVERTPPCSISVCRDTMA